MNTERLYAIFQNSIEAKMNAGELLLDDIATTSQTIVNCLLNEGKILTCGNGASAALAQILTNNLLHRFERDRPSLPTINLGCSLPNITSIASEQHINDIFAKEIRAYGHPNDILVVLSSSGNPPNLVQAVQAAHDKNMTVIALTGRNGGNIGAILDEGDKEIRAPSDFRARIHEVHLLIIFCLCDLIDEQLFGPHQQ